MYRLLLLLALILSALYVHSLYPTYVTSILLFFFLYPVSLYPTYLASNDLPLPYPFFTDPSCILPSLPTLIVSYLTEPEITNCALCDPVIRVLI